MEMRKKFQCGNWDIFYANQTYYGIPYDQAAIWNTTGDCVDMNEFNNLIKGGKTINGRIGRSDCSSTVSLAMRQVDKSVKITGTSYMYPGANGFIAVGDYSFKTNTVQTCLNNGKTKMFNAYKLLQPGDCIVHNGNYKNNKGETVYIGHAILIVGNNPSKETVTVVHQSSGNYVYNPKTKTCWSRGPSDYSRGIINNTLPRNSSWGVNCEIKYSALLSDYYIPLTCKVLAKSSPSTVTKPSAPSSVTFKSTSLGKGDTLVASWGKVPGANKYNVKVFCNGKQKDSKSITGTSYSYKANDEGTYYVTVSASNSAGTSSEKKSGNATVYPNYTVKWVDFDGSVIKTQTVKYGGNGTNPPANPVREGYTFQGWDKTANSIKANTTITATYKINTYSVTFVDYNGGTIGSVQRVDYGKSATAPENVPVQAGYKFIGWNTEDYKSVTKSMTVSAVYEWENTDLPIGMNITSAKRNEEGTG